MSVRTWNLLLVIGLIVVLSGGGYALYANQQHKMAKQAEAQQAAEEELAERQSLEELGDEFAVFLNQFIQNVGREAGEYKAARKVLTGLLQPGNLRDAQYVEENYKLGESTVMSLQLQMDTIMGEFDKADEYFETIVTKWPKERQHTLRETWEQTRAQHAQMYVAYFESERALLAAMQDILSFYNEHKDALRVDEEFSAVTFDDPALQARHAELMAEVEALKEMQKELLSREESAQAEESEQEKTATEGEQQ